MTKKTFVILALAMALAGCGDDRRKHVAAFNKDCAAHGFAPGQCAFLLKLSDQADDAKSSADGASAAAASASILSAVRK